MTAAKAVPTEYVVLERDPLAEPERATPDAPVAWREADTITGTGPEATLLRKWGEKNGRSGAFKLVPARAWRGGVKLGVQQKPEVTVEAL